MITVIPNFMMDQVDFCSGRFGPFSPPDPVSIPLWLAILLKESGRCKLVTPDWMNKDALQETLKNERENVEFQPLPFHYKEIAKLLCRWRADVPDCTEVERLLLELDSLRDEKIRRGVATMRGNGNGYKLTSLTAMEINTARSLMGLIMDTMQAYDSHSTHTPPPLAGDLNAHLPQEESQLPDTMPVPEAEELHQIPLPDTPAVDTQEAAPIVMPAPHVTPDASVPTETPQAPKRRRLRR